MVATAVPTRRGPTATITIMMAMPTAGRTVLVRVPIATSVAPSLAPLTRAKAEADTSRRAPSGVMRELQAKPAARCSGFSGAALDGRIREYVGRLVQPQADDVESPQQLAAL